MAEREVEIIAIAIDRIQQLAIKTWGSFADPLLLPHVREQIVVSLRETESTLRELDELSVVDLNCDHCTHNLHLAKLITGEDA